MMSGTRNQFSLARVASITACASARQKSKFLSVMKYSVATISVLLYASIAAAQPKPNSARLQTPETMRASIAAPAAKRLLGEGRIALCLRDTAGRLQIFTIRPDGTDTKQLTFDGDNGIPAWSRDGTRITYSTIRSEGPWVAVMNADGSNQKLLAQGIASDWHPDGGRIAFSCGNQICVMDADGGNRKQVTHSDTFKARPAWSPDGKRMAFILLQNPGSRDDPKRSPGDPKPQIGIVNADGSGERLLTVEKRVNVHLGPGGSKTIIETAYDANAPAWSPVGDRIAFWSGIENQYGQIWTIRADGTGSRQLTDDPRHRNSDDPSWSPDGKKVLFSTARSGKGELWLMNADGSGQRRLSDIDAGPFPGRASWQPVKIGVNP
jgi:TolB protein